MEEGRRQLAVIRWGDNYIAAVLVGNKLDNVIVEPADEQTLRTGDIYVGKVNHIVKNIHAAFVEVQKNVMCYLPMNESGAEKIVQGQEFPVQVRKAAVKKKQAVVSRNLEFSGKYAVVTVLNRTKAISSKITDDAVRGRLMELLVPFRESPYGIILRTSCRDAAEELIYAECESLLQKAEETVRMSRSRTRFTKVYRSDREVIKFLRDLEQGTFDRIITDDRPMYELLAGNPVCEDENIVLYEDESYPLDKLLSIGVQLEHAMKRHVWLKSGGSLVIEPTEALTVIDVNTEKAIEGKRSSEATFFKINMEAAKEAARQIRIRNISGIILIDFIDMKNREHVQELMRELRNEFQKDTVRTTVVDMTKLGLVEITRMKIRKPLWESL